MIKAILFDSAKAAGVFCIAVASTHEPEELTEADAIISSLAELTPEYMKNISAE
jgi:phosphoglycolate phosphatase-like HAD superfamily hydrolase